MAIATDTDLGGPIISLAGMMLYFVEMVLLVKMIVMYSGPYLNTI